ncbi:hypothetical protein P4B35_16810 [Pontiellaceae bacterium B12227]|nr:hypothetical protein [Pontiellaceae bacterium B12227]
MSTQKRRLNKLSKRVPNPDEEPIFCCWLDHPWTDEEKAEARTQHPDRKTHWKSLSNTLPLEGHHLQ